MKAYTFVVVTECDRATSVKVYHHGSFGLQRGQLKYLGGETTVIDYCNEDEWSLIEVYDIVSRQGYLKKDIAAIWYKSQDQNTEEALRMLRTDKDAMNMVELFVVHKTSDIHEVVEDVHLLGSTESSMQVKGGGSDGPGPMVTSEAQTVGLVEKNSGPNVEEEIGSDGSEDEDYDPKGGEDDSCDSWSSDSRNGDGSEDSANEVVFGDSDDDKEWAEGLVDVNIRVGDRFEAASTETQTDAAKASGSAKGKEKVVAGLGDEEEGYDSEEFLDMPITDDDENGNSVAKKYPLHKQLKDMSEYKWEVGTLYVSREEFKDCATAYAVHTGRGLRFDKVDLRRVKVTCVEGCNWFAYCGKIKNEQTWQLTSCHNKHTCSRELKIGIMHAKWLSKVFLKKITENPKIKLSTLIKKAYSKWNVELTKSKAARVKQFALDELQGTYIEQYRRLYDYCHELLRSNPADASGKWVSTYAGRDKYEVTSIHGGKEKFVVDLKNHECSCRKFQLSGIPCAHAMTCIRKMCFNVDNSVANCYKKETYMNYYQHVVYPVNGPNLWVKTQFDDVLPPVYRKPIGRPKLKRNKAADENSSRGGVSHDGQTQKCSYYFARGHNKRTCPKKQKVAATSSANKVAGSTRRASRVISSTISSTVSSTISSQASRQSQAAAKNTTTSRPKRKLSSNDISSQQSQAMSKKAKMTPTNNNSGQQLKDAAKDNNLRVLPTPSKHVSISQLKFMARTPPKAWKKM
ncbi:hypothetical protein Ahy_A09g043852 [Arachis hypogaea]|uniref:SWIM-type domain-containing protein n=1 Tax=Arachis hypogaea TaxID=3818 RepID=A0A445BJC4_ARAHY|nr:hypothetical protein Ahy_A09g043852 [Arachis hypogaea]